MPSVILSPGNVTVVSLHLDHVWRGTWVADLEIDLPKGTPGPTGKVTLTLQTPSGKPTTLTGTVDPRGSGPFVEFYHLRVLGGGAGWDKPVRRQSYDSDGGVTDVRVYSATALEVGETVHVPTPVVLGTHYLRSAGPASRVLDGVDWWVGLDGVTNIGPRPSAKPDPSTTLLSWDPTLQMAELVSDGIVMPGTSISDPRIPNGPVIVRDVEQVFDRNGSKVTAWCGANPVSQLAGDLRSMVREFSGVTYATARVYRVIIQNSDGRLQLQAVHSAEGYPDTLPIEVWGPSGWSTKVTPGCQCLVEFVGGEPTQPVVRAFQAGQLPIEVTVDATSAVKLGGGGAGVARVGDEIDYSALVVTAPAGTAGGPCTLSGTLKVKSGSTKVTSG